MPISYRGSNGMIASYHHDLDPGSTTLLYCRRHCWLMWVDQGAEADKDVVRLPSGVTHRT